MCGAYAQAGPAACVAVTCSGFSSCKSVQEGSPQPPHSRKHLHVVSGIPRLDLYRAIQRGKGGIGTRALQRLVMWEPRKNSYTPYAIVCRGEF